VINQVSEQAPGDFLATIADFVEFERPVPSAEGPSVNHQTSILPIKKEDFDKLVRLGSADVTEDELTLDAIRDAGNHVIPYTHPDVVATQIRQAVARAVS
jgi:hypothetical protein